jgi:hypothetical protein
MTINDLMTLFTTIMITTPAVYVLHNVYTTGRASPHKIYLLHYQANVVAGEDARLSSVIDSLPPTLAIFRASSLSSSQLYFLAGC